jgi:hypothetical protein
MHRIGVITVWFGILSSAVGLIVGFSLLLSGNGENAGFWLGMIPVGFLFLTVGTVTSQLSGRK